MLANRLPTYFISHGGGPWPYMTGAFRTLMAQLEQSLVDMRRELDEVPRAVLVVSGHWEERGFAISSGEMPRMVYDYNGFPDDLYAIRYAAPDPYYSLFRRVGISIGYRPEIHANSGSKP